MRDFHNKEIPHISQVTLRVTSLQNSSIFYQELLGLNVSYEDENKVVLSSVYGDVITLEQATKPYEFTEGLFHVAYIMPSLKDLAEWFLYQNNRGTKIYGASDHLVSSAFYLNDPDGNGVEVYADTDNATWKYESYGILMDTLPLDIRKMVSGVEVPDTIKNEVRVGHVHLKSRNIMEMAAFYQKLSFDVTLDMGSAVFMSHNKYHHHLAINGWNRASMIEHNDESVDIKEIVMTYPNKDSQLKVVENLQNSGLDVLKDMEDYIVFDPIGIAVRLQG